MATARKAPIKREAPQQSAAAVKAARARKAGKPSSDDDSQVPPAKKVAAKRASAKRSLNGDAGHAEKEKPARASNAKAGKPNGSAQSAEAQALARVSEPGRQTRADSSAEAAVPVRISGLTPAVMRPPYWDGACADLVKRDRILKKLIPKFGPVHLINGGDPFVTLARSMVGQQISVQAAQAVWGCVEAACPKLTPQQFIKLGQEKLKACGLSKRKAEYILDLAQHFVSGALHVDKWMSMEDEAVIAELTQIRGIGRWTAEMFLIFNLSRPNVLPLDDLGLIRAISINYFSGEPVTRSEAREVAANWEPWRTVATWYMWRSLDPLVSGG
jgi:DNA-3-methyladenine glycosylase II